MTSYDTDEYKSTKAKLKVIGGILVFTGVIIVIFGALNIITAFTSFSDLDTSPTDDGFPSFDIFGQFAIGGFASVVGFAFIGFGAQLFLTAHARAISRYTAIEGAPAVEIMSEAFASGVSKGLQRSGRAQSFGDREIVKIKCRKCGYLETEDATFCSKCGNEI
jgi:ribosomal protein L40E